MSTPNSIQITYRTIQRIYEQDCVLTFNSVTYRASASLIHALDLGVPLDASGYPVMLESREIRQLRTLASQTLLSARSNYFVNLKAVELEVQTQVDQAIQTFTDKITEGDHVE